VYDAGYASGRRGGTRSAARADLHGRRGSAGDDELDSRLGFQWQGEDLGRLQKWSRAKQKGPGPYIRRITV
jgi:hypothetical protein